MGLNPNNVRLFCQSQPSLPARFCQPKLRSNANANTSITHTVRVPLNRERCQCPVGSLLVWICVGDTYVTKICNNNFYYHSEHWQQCYDHKICKVLSEDLTLFLHNIADGYFPMPWQEVILVWHSRMLFPHDMVKQLFTMASAVRILSCLNVHSVPLTLPIVVSYLNV